MKRAYLWFNWCRSYSLFGWRSAGPLEKSEIEKFYHGEHKEKLIKLTVFWRNLYNMRDSIEHDNSDEAIGEGLIINEYHFDPTSNYKIV